MMNSVNFNFQQPQPQMDPNEYLKNYMNETGKSEQEAKEELQSLYGEPDRNGSAFNDSNYNVQNLPHFSNDTSILNQLNQLSQDDTQILNELGISDLLNNSDTDSGSILQKFLGLLKGGNTQRPDNSLDVDAFAQRYADIHNLSIDEAKEELKNTYGEPEINQNANNGLDAFAQRYADAHNLSLDEAKEELKSIYGDPSEMGKNTEVTSL